MNYYCEHNICPMVTELPAKTDTVVVNRDLHLEQIAQVLNINIEHLRNLNPEYRRDIVNGLNKPKTVRLPESLVGAFIDNEDSIYNFKTDELLLKRDVVDVKEDTPSVGRNHSYSRSRSSYSSRSRSSYSRKSKKCCCNLYSMIFIFRLFRFNICSVKIRKIFFLSVFYL